MRVKSPGAICIRSLRSWYVPWQLSELLKTNIGWLWRSILAVARKLPPFLKPNRLRWHRPITIRLDRTVEELSRKTCRYRPDSYRKWSSESDFQHTFHQSSTKEWHASAYSFAIAKWNSLFEDDVRIHETTFLHKNRPQNLPFVLIILFESILWKGDRQVAKLRAFSLIFSKDLTLTFDQASCLITSYFFEE